jgi:hypothetical protein
MRNRETFLRPPLRILVRAFATGHVAHVVCGGILIGLGAADVRQQG